jgi:F0F1-type ATP synthase membrane subunit b/b'
VEIISQLGELFLQAVPTVIIVFLFYLFLRWSFFQPIQRVLAERHRRAEGSRMEAEASRAAANEKQRQYNESLRKARAEIFADQEAQRRQTLEERQATINAVRARAQRNLQEAKKGIARDLAATQAELEGTSEALANEIAQTILAGRPSGPRTSPGKVAL